MAFNDIERKSAEKIISAYVESIRPDPSIRKQVDISYRIEGQSILIIELRPRYQNESEIQEIPVAKATYVRSSREWKVFWMRADLKWHSYASHPVVKKLEEFVGIVKLDQLCCFWG